MKISLISSWNLNNFLKAEHHDKKIKFHGLKVLQHGSYFEILRKFPAKSDFRKTFWLLLRRRFLLWCPEYEKLVSKATNIQLQPTQTSPVLQGLSLHLYNYWGACGWATELISQCQDVTSHLIRISSFLTRAPRDWRSNEYGNWRGTKWAEDTWHHTTRLLNSKQHTGRISSKHTHETFIGTKHTHTHTNK